jgi:hypothetical protein
MYSKGLYYDDNTYSSAYISQYTCLSEAGQNLVYLFL